MIIIAITQAKIGLLIKKFDMKLFLVVIY